MEKEQIRKEMAHVKTPTELLGFINELKEESEGEHYKPIDSDRFFYFLNPNNEDGRYVNFLIPKKRKGEFRQISAPKHELMAIQNVLKDILEAYYEPNTNAMGFVQGRSVVNNAMAHIRQNYILNIDLKDFFPSITRMRVWKCLQLKPMSFTEKVAGAIAGLCSMKIEKDSALAYVLPQGAPTSPVLSNIICRKMDKRLNRLASTFGLNYTRYADDITFSSKHYVYAKEGDFIVRLHETIEEEGFVLNETKTRLQKNGERKEVTGLVVSDRANVSKKYIREIRSLLYMWERYGYDVAYSKFYPHYKAEKGHVKKGEPSLENVLCGKLLYLKMVKGETNNTYLKLKERLDNLLRPVVNLPELATDNSLTYIVCFKLNDFAKSFNIGNIDFYVDGNGHMQAKCDVTGSQIPRVIYVSRQAEEFLFDIEAKKGLVALNNHSTMESLHIALCESKNRRHFWLIMANAPITRSDAFGLTSHSLIEKWEREGMSAAEKAYRQQKQYMSAIPKEIDSHSLIDIWEKEGLEAAIQSYMNYKSITPIQKESSPKIGVDNPKSTDIPEESANELVYDFSQYEDNKPIQNILSKYIDEVSYEISSPQ